MEPITREQEGIVPSLDEDKDQDQIILTIVDKVHAKTIVLTRRQLRLSGFLEQIIQDPDATTIELKELCGPCSLVWIGEYLKRHDGITMPKIEMAVSLRSSIKDFWPEEERSGLRWDLWRRDCTWIQQIQKQDQENLKPLNDLCNDANYMGIKPLVDLCVAALACFYQKKAPLEVLELLLKWNPKAKQVEQALKDLEGESLAVAVRPQGLKRAREKKTAKPDKKKKTAVSVIDLSK